MDNKLRKQLKIPAVNLAEVNQFLLDPNNKLVNDILAVVAKHGTIDEIKGGTRLICLGKFDEKGRLLATRIDIRLPR